MALKEALLRLDDGIQTAQSEISRALHPGHINPFKDNDTFERTRQWIGRENKWTSALKEDMLKREGSYRIKDLCMLPRNEAIPYTN